MSRAAALTHRPCDLWLEIAQLRTPATVQRKVATPMEEFERLFNLLLAWRRD
jgi:hypothetical protein